MDEDTHPTDAEITRTIKAVLRKAFPGAKFSVTRGGSWIEWADGPERAAVENAILAAGLAEPQEGYDGKRWLRTEGSRSNSIHLDRYSPAERAANQQDAERRRAEYEARTQRIDAALAENKQKKREAIGASALAKVALDNNGLQAVTQAFETLRERAEAAIAIEGERERRPSWAPPLMLDGELLELCRALEYLTPDDPPIARLWASYANPKRSGRILREEISTLPLVGVDCRGVQLFAGSERGNVSRLLFEAQRTQAGDWRFGPQLYMSQYYSPRVSEWERLTRDRLTIEDRLAGDTADPSEQAKLDCLTQLIALINKKDLAGAGKHRRASEQRTRVVQLAQQRVLEFVGAPDAQMQLAARLCGHCCFCFRELTDPISLERGIGPDCYHNLIEFIRARSAKPIDWLVRMTGMPPDFVVAIIAQTPQPQLELRLAP